MFGPQFTYSRQFLNLDFSIWLVITGTILTGLILLGFKSASHVSCSEAKITLKGNSPTGRNDLFIVGEDITFTAAMKSPSEVEWEFGDGSLNVKGNEVKHKFLEERRFTVTATLNGKCKEIIAIRVQRLHEIPKKTDEGMAGETYVRAGKEISFHAEKDASVYAWSIEELPALGIKNGRDINFTFPDTTGTFKLKLMLDNDDQKVYSKWIVVSKPGEEYTNLHDKYPLPQISPINTPPVRKSQKTELTTQSPVAEEKPAEKKPVSNEKTYPQVPAELIKSMLEAVVDKKKTAASFDEYLCQGANTQVTANGSTMTLTELCRKLQEKKGLPGFKRSARNIVIENLRRADNNCIQSFFVRFDL